MSDSKRKSVNVSVGEPADEKPEDYLGDEDDSSLSITPGDDLQAALQEAAAALDPEEGAADSEKSAPSADNLMLEAISSELQALKAQYEEQGVEFAELQDRHTRLQAEFENFRRRSLKERQEAFQYGHQNIVKDLLTTVDNLERASQHAEDSGGGDLQSLLQGVDLVSRELLGVFGKYGVTTIEALNKPFDPALHEAMGQLEDASVPANTVIQVLQSGYLLRDRMLRPALVMVSRLPEGAKVESKPPAEDGSTDEDEG